MNAEATMMVPSAGLGAERSDRRLDSIVMVRWALAIVCAYMVLFSEGSTGPLGIGPLVIVAFLVSNLVVGRLPEETIGTPRFAIGIGIMDSVLIAASLSAAGQLSVELLVLLLGVLVMTIAGFRLSTVASATMGITAASFAIAWAGGTESLVRSSMLVRAPFLLVAAVAYAWLVESGRDSSPLGAGISAGDIAPVVLRQSAAIERCRDAMAQGQGNLAASQLLEVAAHNRQLLARLGVAHPSEPEVTRDAA